MHHAQLITFGLESRLAETLQEPAAGRSLWLREVRHVKTCLNLLRRGGADLLMLQLGKNLDDELLLLEHVTHLFPSTRTIVVGPAQNPPLAALVWDLGAAYVLFPPQPIETIREVVLGFLPQVNPIS